MSRTWQPSAASPVTPTCARAFSRAMPFVKMRHAISCGMVTVAAIVPTGLLASSHPSPR
jgi:hypothetical protein